MAKHSLDRRYCGERRRAVDSASDLHQRIEEKRDQIERRRIVRRASDRERLAANGVQTPANAASARQSKGLSEQDDKSTDCAS